MNAVNLHSPGGGRSAERVARWHCETVIIQRLLERGTSKFQRISTSPCRRPSLRLKFNWKFPSSCYPEWDLSLLDPRWKYTNSVIHRTLLNLKIARNHKLKQLNFPLIFETWLTSESIENIFFHHSANEMKTKTKPSAASGMSDTSHRLILPAQWCADVRYKKRAREMQISHTENWIQ